MKTNKLFLAISLLIISIDSFAIIPDTVYIRKPEQLGLMYKELNVVTNDGYKIATWFFPTQEPLLDSDFISLGKNKRDYKPLHDTPQPTIIICNGDAGNMSYLQLHLAQSLTTMGFNVVTFDWRGFGISSSFPMNKNYLCYTEMLEDYRAVIEIVTQQPEVKSKATTVMGWSTEAYLSMITAYNNKNVNALIGRSLATDFKDFIPLAMKVRHKTIDQFIIPSDFPADQMPIHIANKFDKPIFLINGENDMRTPVWMSEKILSLLPENTPYYLMVVKNAAHGGMEDPIVIDFENFINNVTEFLKKHLSSNDNAS